MDAKACRKEGGRWNPGTEQCVKEGEKIQMLAINARVPLKESKIDRTVDEFEDFCRERSKAYHFSFDVEG